MSKRSFTAIVCASVVLLGLVGCGASPEHVESTEISPAITKNGWTLAFENPHGWSSVWKRCDGPNLVYLIEGSRESSISAVPNSPECLKIAPHTSPT